MKFMPMAFAAALAFSAGSLQAQGVVIAEPAQTIQPVAPAPGSPQTVQPSQASWPRSYEKDGNSVLLYQPQVDAWKDCAKIRFRAAIVVAKSGVQTPFYGVLAAQADTLVDHSARTVIISNLDVSFRFPGLDDGKAGEVKAIALEALPSKSSFDVPLDQVVAYMHGSAKVPSVELNLDPPKIFYSESPAILVNFIGQPQFKPIPGTELLFAVNSNWAVILDTIDGSYYLLNNDFWLKSQDPVKGPWLLAATLPYEFNAIPDGEQWSEIKSKIPGRVDGILPKVFTSVSPSELIVVAGPPEFEPIPGTRLMHLSNSKMPVFLDMLDQSYYFLAAGRWFRAPSLKGPWSAASKDLPSEFAKIPHDDKFGYVLASVPGTQEAQDAILLASVPHKATVDKASTTVQVVYDGAPQFVAIKSSPMSYAVNTPYQVVLVNGTYYCCYQGVWFQSLSATGPWAVSVSVDPLIYTIPPSCPIYNVTYVRVYDSTPSTVTVGYTSGYSGEYVAATGALMFGAGMLTMMLVGENNGWFNCSPCGFSYGCGTCYNYAYGGFYRPGFPGYGPGGGAGWGAVYNPSTGAWARGGYAYGPNGARWGYQAYNPFTNTYVAHGGGTNGYSSWGHGVVSQDGQWAAGAHVSTPFGSRGWAADSNGQWIKTDRIGDTYAAKASNGDIYAGRDGNLYRKSDGQWQKYDGNGNWSQPSWNKPVNPNQNEHLLNQANPEAQRQNSRDEWNSSSWRDGFDKSSGGGEESRDSLNRDSWARDRGSENASSWERSSRGGGFHGGFHGRR